MFAIYNIQGRTFRNSLEQLKKVHDPHAVQASDIHTDTAQDETVVIQGTESATPATAKSLQAYRQMLHTKEREVIIHAYQIMSHPVKTLLDNTSLETAYKDFQALGYQQMPIINPQHQLVGLLTYQQLFSAFHEQQSNPKMPISEIMHGDVITADPVSEIRRVARVLYEYQLPALPVVNEHDQLVGIVSKTDLLKSLMMEPPINLWT